MSELNFVPEGLSLPQTADACRTRLVSLQAEVASIRLQIATTDIRRQTEKKALDASAFHRAKTALRLKQYELGLVSAQLAKLAQGSLRGAFKDTLIELVREQFDDRQWSQLVSRAKAAHQFTGEHHG